MNVGHRVSRLAVIVPFHNEERFLPRLIESFRAQRDVAARLVFVNNGSTDRSPDLVRNCDEVRAGQWQCIDEPIVGKFHALRAGVAYCAERFGAEFVASFDADAYHGGPDWLRVAAEIIETAGDDFGYSYSCFGYSGFEHLLVFSAAYRAYEAVLHDLIEHIGWTVGGQGFLASSRTMQNYLARAEPTDGVDLPLSLLALSENRVTAFHRVPMISSGRRMIANQQNFERWCFYDERYYATRDINAPTKLDLNRRSELVDLAVEDVDRFFVRRATKLVARDLIPLVIYDRRGERISRVAARFGEAIAGAIDRAFRHLASDVTYFLTNRYQELLAQITPHLASRQLAEAVAAAMRVRYRERTGVHTAPLSHL